MALDPDLIITIAYFSIPLQLVVSLYQYPRLAKMPMEIVILIVLFALFIFLCGTVHFIRFLGHGDTHLFFVMNTICAMVSLSTAIYLLPLIPRLLGSLDKNIQDLVKMNEETAESKQKLFTFMAFLCHEVRNPLFAITSSASFLGDTELTAEQETGVGSIFDSSLLMLRLVNDVLDLSKIDAGKLELEERDFDLHSLLENLEGNMKLQVKQKQDSDVKFKFSMSEDVPRIINGDSTRMLQIIYNLLSNSTKFTSKGHISLDVSVCDEFEAVDLAVVEENYNVSDVKNKQGSENMFSMALLDAAEQGVELKADNTHKKVLLRITVTDTGDGIDPDRIANIFEPYCQSKISHYRKHGGTGLGLSIISNLVKLMEGKISVTSKVGKGTSFLLYLPVRVAHDQNTVVIDTTDMTDPFLSARRLPVYKEKIEEVSGHTKIPDENSGVEFFNPRPKKEKTSEESKEATSKKKKKRKSDLPRFDLPSGSWVVLVVDDNCVNRKILGKMLSFYNIEYQEAVNGLDAVKTIEKSRNMTQNSDAPWFGLILMDLSMPVMDGYEAIETLRQKGCTIPIVALTANALSRERDRALEAGADDFHTKPILRSDLHAVCSRYERGTSNGSSDR